MALPVDPVTLVATTAQFSIVTANADASSWCTLDVDRDSLPESDRYHWRFTGEGAADFEFEYEGDIDGPALRVLQAIQADAAAILSQSAVARLALDQYARLLRTLAQ